MTEHEKFLFNHGYKQAEREYRRVIEDIKAEIDNSKLDYPIVDEVLAIINKHISRKVRNNGR